MGEEEGNSSKAQSEITAGGGVSSRIASSDAEGPSQNTERLTGLAGQPQHGIDLCVPRRGRYSGTGKREQKRSIKKTREGSRLEGPDYVK